VAVDSSAGGWWLFLSSFMPIEERSDESRDLQLFSTGTDNLTQTTVLTDGRRPLPGALSFGRKERIKEDV
jgi:hypothetical protein